MGTCQSKNATRKQQQQQRYDVNMNAARQPVQSKPRHVDHPQFDDVGEAKSSAEMMQQLVAGPVKSSAIYEAYSDTSDDAYGAYAEAARRLSTDDPYDVYMERQENYGDFVELSPELEHRGSETGRAFLREAKGMSDNDDNDGSASSSPRHAAEESKLDGGDVALWNQEYQNALDMPERTPAEERLKYDVLNKLSLDFVQLAIMYGRTIISELYFKDRNERTITNRFGGKAGGEKFVVHGIVFKLAQDCELSNQQWLYGGAKPNTEYASKSMSLELKGSLHYSTSLNEVKISDESLATVRIPMQVLVDYRGFRLMVMPLLPLNSDSLIYGSCDGSVTVHDKDEAFASTMKACAKLMHLQGHIVGKGVGGRMLYAAGDVEGHIGTDGRYYMLDFARTFPPESFVDTLHLTPHPQSVFIRMLRPELLRHLKDHRLVPPLSPDGLCRWGVNDPDFQKHYEDIRDATKHLLEEVIPSFAQWLDRRIDIASPAEIKSFDMALQMHSRGVNMRHLGYVRTRTRRKGGASHLLLQEMVKRTLKNILRAWLRAETREQRPSSHMVVRLVAGFCNLVVMSNEAMAQRFWSELVATGVMSRFGKCALDEEDGDAAQLIAIVKTQNPLVYVEYCLSVCGMVLSDNCVQELKMLRSAFGFQFTAADVKDGALRVKHMSFLDYVQGKHMVNQAELYERSAPRVAARLLKLSAERFSAGLSMEPGNILLRKRLALSRSKRNELEDAWLERGVGHRYAADDALLSFVDEMVNGAAWNAYISSVIDEVFTSLFAMWARRRQDRSDRIYSHYAGGASNQRVLRRTQRLLDRYRARCDSASFGDVEIECAWRYRNATALVFWNFLRSMAQALNISDLADVLQYLGSASANSRVGRRSFIKDQSTPSYSRHMLRVASQRSMQTKADTGGVDPQFVYGDRASALARQLRDTPGVLKRIAKLVVVAAQNGHGFMLAFLQEMGIDVNRFHDDDGTLAMEAAANGNEPLLASLIRAGVDLEVVDERGDNALQLAVNGKNLESAKTLLATKLSLSGRNKDGLTPLMVAVQRNDPEMVQSLLDNGANLEDVDHRGRTVLHTAASKGYDRVVSVLVNAGANLQAYDYHHAAPLHLAAIKGHVGVMRVLVECGRVDMGATADYDRSAVYLACDNDQIGAVRYLINVDASAVSVRDALGGTPIWVAASAGSTDIVRMLIQEFGADVHQATNDGSTPLWIAANTGSVDCVNVLLEAGADVEQADVLQRTVLIGACIHGHADVVRALLACETPPSLESTDSEEMGKRTALIATCMEGYTDTAVVLLDAGANIEAYNGLGQTSLGVACLMGHMDTVQMLLSRGANVNWQDSNLETALMLAAVSGQTEICELLIQHGASVTVTNRSKQTALHLAALEGHANTMNVLISNAASVDAVDDTEATPLHNSCGAGYLQCIRTLVEHNANVESRDNNGVTPLYLAVYNAQAEATELLMTSFGADITARHAVGWTPVWIAAYKGYVPVLFVLLNKSDRSVMNVNEPWKAMTPLFAAAQQGHTDAVKLLLEAGADVSIKNEDGLSPLEVAIDRQHNEVIQCFTGGDESNETRPHNERVLSRDDELDVLDERARIQRLSVMRHARTGSVYRRVRAEEDVYAMDTSIVWCCKQGDLMLARFLLESKADVNACDDKQRSCLWLACDDNNMELIELLIGHGGDVNDCDVDAVSMLSEAAACGRVALVKYLLEHGANEGSRNKMEETPLSRAASAGHGECIRLLHGAGARLEFKHKLGETPLMRATKNSHFEAVRVLLECKSNINCTDDDGRTPLMVASERGAVDMVRLLLANRASLRVRSKSKKSALDLAKASVAHTKSDVITLLSGAAAAVTVGIDD